LRELPLEKEDKITVVGAGRTGFACTRVLTELNGEVFLSEQGEMDREVRRFCRNEGVEFEEEGHSSRTLDSSLMVVSPGVPLDAPLVKRALKEGIEVLSEVELAYRLSPTEKLIGVTGTNGKTTTVELVNFILKKSGRDPYLCGNVGRPFIDLIPELEEGDEVVIELSSYQLEGTELFRPRVGVLLNLKEDHLKRHGSMRAYREAKLKLFQNQTKEDWALLGRELKGEGFQLRGPRVVRFGPSDSPLPLKGHYAKNLAAAWLAANCLAEEELEIELNREELKPLLELPHRLEFVAEVEGVEFYDDSKGTNPSAAAAAIEYLGDRPLWILLGGRLKGGGYGELSKEIEAHSNLQGVFLFGEGAEKLSSIFAERDVDWEMEETMEKATENAFRQATPGEAVLLSPAGSSFDAYADYKERGRRFQQLVEELAS